MSPKISVKYRLETTSADREVHMFGKSGFIVFGLAAFITVSAAATLAHGNATGVVKARMNIMENVGAAMKMLSGMAKGHEEFDAVKAAEAARKVSEDIKGFTALFPEGSGHAPSEAAPAIWTDMDEFSKFSTQLEAASAAAADTLSIATDKTAVAAVMHDMGVTCKACHSKFRIKR